MSNALNGFTWGATLLAAANERLESPLSFCLPVCLSINPPHVSVAVLCDAQKNQWSSSDRFNTEHRAIPCSSLCSIVFCSATLTMTCPKDKAKAKTDNDESLDRGPN